MLLEGGMARIWTLAVWSLHWFAICLFLVRFSFQLLASPFLYVFHPLVDTSQGKTYVSLPSRLQPLSRLLLYGERCINISEAIFITLGTSFTFLLGANIFIWVSLRMEMWSTCKNNITVTLQPLWIDWQQILKGHMVVKSFQVYTNCKNRLRTISSINMSALTWITTISIEKNFQIKSPRRKDPNPVIYLTDILNYFLWSMWNCPNQTPKWRQ